MSSEGEVSNPAGNDAKVQAILAEFATQKNEISGRTRDQFVIVSGALAVTAILIAGVASKPEEMIGLLLILPWLLGILGMMWCDHDAGIQLIGKYVRTEIEQKKLPNALGEPGQLTTISGETWGHELGRKKPRLGFISTLLPWLFFFVPAISSIVAYWSIRSRHKVNIQAYPELELGLTALSLLAILAGLYMRYRPRS